MALGNLGWSSRNRMSRLGLVKWFVPSYPSPCLQEEPTKRVYNPHHLPMTQPCTLRRGCLEVWWNVRLPGTRDPENLYLDFLMASSLSCLEGAMTLVLDIYTQPLETVMGGVY